MPPGGEIGRPVSLVSVSRCRVCTWHSAGPAADLAPTRARPRQTDVLLAGVQVSPALPVRRGDRP